MLKAVCLPIFFALFSTVTYATDNAANVELASTASCYREICVGDFVTSRSRSGAIIDGEVTRILGRGTLEVTWYWYNSWPYHVPNSRVSYNNVRKSQGY